MIYYVYEELMNRFSKYLSGMDADSPVYSLNPDIRANDTALMDMLTELGYAYYTPDDDFDAEYSISHFETKLGDYLGSNYNKDNGRYAYYVLSVMDHYFG